MKGTLPEFGEGEVLFRQGKEAMRGWAKCPDIGAEKLCSRQSEEKGSSARNGRGLGEQKVVDGC